MTRRLNRSLRAWATIAALALLPVVSLAGAQPTTLVLADPSIDAELSAALSNLEQASADRARAEAELTGLADVRATAQRRVRERTRALYRMRHTGALPLAGGFSALLTHMGRSARMRRMLTHDLDALDELSRRGDALRAEITRAEATSSTARAEVTRLESQRHDAEIAGLEAALGTSTFRGVVEHALGPSTGGTIVLRDASAAVRDASDPAAAFEALRGTLTLPLVSPSRIEEVLRDDGAALALTAPSGSSVRAASAGRVAYAGRHSAYGRLLILDHGGSYFTVYGGLGVIRASVGDELRAGDPVGSLDREPLLFQVRRGTRALPPRPWLGL
jgi:septal ring factor EnvC (AmiA/AmiB activator)